MPRIRTIPVVVAVVLLSSLLAPAKAAGPCLPTGDADARAAALELRMGACASSLQVKGGGGRIVGPDLTCSGDGGGCPFSS